MVDENGEAKLRTVTWNSDYHMLYIDNPVSLLINSPWAIIICA